MSRGVALHRFGASLESMEKAYEEKTGMSIRRHLERRLVVIENTNGQSIPSLRRSVSQPRPSLESLLDALNTLSLEDKQHLVAAVKVLESAPAPKALGTTSASKTLQAGSVPKALETGPHTITAQA